MLQSEQVKCLYRRRKPSQTGVWEGGGRTGVWEVGGNLPKTGFGKEVETGDWEGGGNRGLGRRKIH
ncbi:MAG TPA: hypothetical protein DCY06_02145 [Bacteroidetes bacterium]|nr:hypothetical protein [Bacteroidota bacterium]